MHMKRLLLLLLWLTTAPAVAGRIFYVDPNVECGTRDGLSHDCAAGHGPFATLDGCNNSLVAGDECQVYGATYTSRIQPTNGGDDTGHVAYRCVSGTCTVSPSSGDSIQTFNRSYVLVDGFTATSRVQVGGPGRTNTILRNLIASGGIETGCGTNLLIEDFTTTLPVQTSSGGTALSIASCSDPNVETGATFSRGTVRGGWNGIQVTGDCTNCTFDDIDVSEAQNHLFEVHEATDLTIKNSILGPGAHFGEHLDLRGINGLTLLNNAIFFKGINPSGDNLIDGAPAFASGTWTIRNNVFIQYNLISSGAIDLNDNSGTNTATYDIDYNAYLSIDPFEATRLMWAYSIGAGSTGYTPTSSGLAAWRTKLGTIAGAGDDANSTFYSNDDYRNSAETWSDNFWGTTAASWQGVLGTGCAHTTSTLWVEDAWGRAFAADDFIEVGRDGVKRQVGTNARTGSFPCDWQLVLKAGSELSQAPADGTWIRSWGETDPGTIAEAVRRGFIPQTGSPLLNGGNDANCGHAISGAACDIGPVEATGATNALTITGNVMFGGTLYWGRVTDETLLQIDCGREADLTAHLDCSHNVSGNYALNVSDNPAGLTFSRWTGDCASCTTAATCTINMDSGPRSCGVAWGPSPGAAEMAAIVPLIGRPPK